MAKSEDAMRAAVDSCQEIRREIREWTDELKAAWNDETGKEFCRVAEEIVGDDLRHVQRSVK